MQFTRAGLLTVLNSYLLCCILLMLSHSVSAIETLHTKVSSVLRQQNLVGASWAIIDGLEKQTGAVGLFNTDDNTLLLDIHKVQVGSITKTLVATGTLSLVTQGLLSLSTPVTEILPELYFDNLWHTSNPILVRHLLDHTSGLPNMRLWHLLNNQATPDSELNEIFNNDPELLHVTSPPGEYFSYSNLGYNILAMVIERVTGERYETVLQQQLLLPLGMTNSSFHYLAQTGVYADTLLAFGHLDSRQSISNIPNYLRVAGQFATTPQDMQKFMAFLMKPKNIDNDRIVNARLLQSMGEVAQTLPQQNGLQVGGQFGLWRRDRHGVLGKCHGGNTLGFQSMICVFPEHQKGFFVAINSDNETADYEKIYQVFIEHLNVPLAAIPAKVSFEQDVDKWFGLYRMSSEFISFAYLDRIFNVVYLSQSQSQSQNENELELWSPASDTKILSHVGGNLFSAHNRTTASHILLVDHNNQPVISAGFTNYVPISLLSYITMTLSLVLGLLALVYIAVRGVYALIKVKGNILKEPITVIFLIIPSLIISISLLVTTPFMELGDFNFTTGLTALVSFLACFLCIPALYPYLCKKFALNMDFYAILAFFQYTLVLGYWQLIPFKLWEL
jgi:CubicO group peptidase (beta-lactamase class C family)